LGVRGKGSGGGELVGGTGKPKKKTPQKKKKQKNTKKTKKKKTTKKPQKKQKKKNKTKKKRGGGGGGGWGVGVGVVFWAGVLFFGGGGVWGKTWPFCWMHGGLVFGCEKQNKKNPQRCLVRFFFHWGFFFFFLEGGRLRLGNHGDAPFPMPTSPPLLNSTLVEGKHSRGLCCDGARSTWSFQRESFLLSVVNHPQGISLIGLPSSQFWRTVLRGCRFF